MSLLSELFAPASRAGGSRPPLLATRGRRFTVGAVAALLIAVVALSLGSHFASSAPTQPAGMAAVAGPVQTTLQVQPIAHDAGPLRKSGSGTIEPIPSVAPTAAAKPAAKAPAPAPSRPAAPTRQSAAADPAADTAGSRTSGSYAVKEGDSLGSIAKKYGISTARLAALNPDADSDDLTIGQSVRLP